MFIDIRPQTRTINPFGPATVDMFASSGTVPTRVAHSGGALMAEFSHEPGPPFNPRYLPDGVTHGGRHLKAVEINYRRNLEADYTEHIRQAYKTFRYEDWSDTNWLDEEFTLLYGSPLYEQSGQEQRRALNHLFWVCFYNYTIGGEVSTMVYNELTTAALFPLGGFGTVCRELDIETGQERDHVEAFHRIGRLTERAILGESVFERPLPGFIRAAVEHPQGQPTRFQWFRNSQAMAFAGAMGCSPFIATQYYVLRGMRNIQLKVKEYQHSQFHEKLKADEKPIPSPTAVAHYHYLDEAFHTATSQLICHDMYKDFPPPKRWERIFSNLGVRNIQRTMNALSGAVPGIFSEDRHYIPLVYRMLQTRLFGMTSVEALKMTEQCFCEEHQGFHVAAKYHQRAWTDNRNYIEDLDYLWTSNRELQLMRKASIEDSLKRNRKQFKRLAKAVARGKPIQFASRYDPRDPRYASHHV